MKTLHYATEINAPRKQVWDIMLGPETFKAWTAEFAEGSYFEGSWDDSPCWGASASSSNWS